MMKTSCLRALLYLALLYTGNAYAQVDVLTQHNDLNRTGWNNQETSLNINNVKIGSFGQLFTVTVDGQIYAQPLIASGVNILSQGTNKNIVYVATVNNSVYAFDADDGTLYWQKNFTTAGFRPPQNTDIHAGLCGPNSYNDFSGKFGIIGTPVIDKTTNTMYVVYREANPALVDNTSHPETAYTSTGFYYYIRAINILDGSDRMPKMQITATANGIGDGNVGGVISFDPRRNHHRSALLLQNGMLYIAFAAHCDWNNYHGWVLGYDAATLTRKVVYISTPNDGRGGIWMSGGGPAADNLGNIYLTTGNGSNGSPTVLENRGESVLKLTPNAPGNAATALTITDYFTPKDFVFLNQNDLDLPIQVMLIPNTNLVLTGAKDGNIYVMTNTNLGGYNASTDNLLQKIPVGGGTNAQMHSSFAYFGGNTNKYFYQFSENTSLKAYPVLGSSVGLSTTPIISGISGPTGFAGAYMSVSSNGGDPSTGILWINHPITGCNANQALCPGVLRALNASDITKELWNSGNVTADNVGTFAKTVCPTIANGKVYMASFSGKLTVYGLTGADPCGTQNIALQSINGGASYTASQSAANAPNAFDGKPATNWAAPDNENITLDLGSQYDICKVVIHWGNLNTQNFEIFGSNDGTNFTSLEIVTNNNFADHTLFLQDQGYRYLRVSLMNRYDFLVNHIINEMEVYGMQSNSCAAPTGISWTNTTDNSGTLSWTAVPGATGYTVQYKVQEVVDWKTVNLTTNSVTLSALTCGEDYQYKIQAACGAGSSAIASGSFTNLFNGSCSDPCVTATATRYSHTDIGNIGMAGSSCFQSFIYTLKGSGADIGGTTDAFQYVYANLLGDEEVTARISSQDATNPFNKAGIMIRDILSVGSRYAFIGITSGQGIVFSYRNIDGSAANTTYFPGFSSPYYLKIKKVGTQYSVFRSPTGLGNSWIQVGSTVDLGFGTGTVYVGPAITSADNTKLSTAIVDNYTENSSPLPIKLLSFTASNINNEYISLHWVTSMELNNDHFEVQRSTDNTHFETIDNIKAVGNSSINQYYETTDNQPGNGGNYYRLKQVDNDGRSTYSYIVYVRYGKQINPVIFPNPATTNFSVIAGLESIIDVELYTVSGKLLQHISNDAGSSNISVSSSNLASGIYIVQIRTATKVYQEKLFKQ